MITAYCFHTALSPPWAFWRTSINARTKHLSVFSDSVKCKTRQRDLGKRGGEVDGLWKIERGDVRDGEGDRDRVRAFFLQGSKERGEMESLMASAKGGQGRTSKE